MTAYCINLQPREVLIASDTLIYTALNEPLGLRDKVLPLPRFRAAFFGRGADAIAVSAMATVALRYDLQDFDAVADALPEILAEVTERVAAEHGIDDPDGLLLFEGRLAGWSPRDKRMRIYLYNNYEGYRKDGGAAPDGWCASPPLEPEFLPPSLKGQPAERICIEVMKAHRRAFAVRLGGDVLPVGGEITLTHVTEHGVSTRIIYKFADAERHGHAAAAVAARVIRGEHPGVDLNAALTRVDDAITVNASGTRAERRRAEKQSRKAARRAA